MTDDPLLYLLAGRRMTDDPLLYTIEVARLLEVAVRTVYMWRHRGIFPPADAAAGVVSLWRRSTVIRWATETGRWHDGHPVAHPRTPQ